MTSRMAMCLLCSIVFANACFAQEEQPKTPQQKFYRLEFVVKELENDKVINSRVHSLSVAGSTGAPASIRTGSRVPYATGVSLPGPGATATKQFNFFDIGVNIDCREAREVAPGQLSLTINADISSLVVTTGSGSDLPPIVRTTRWSSPVLLPVKKPTTVFSSDDPSGNRKMQLELTAIPIL